MFSNFVFPQYTTIEEIKASNSVTDKSAIDQITEDMIYYSTKQPLFFTLLLFCLRFALIGGCMYGELACKELDDVVSCLQ